MRTDLDFTGKLKGIRHEEKSENSNQRISDIADDNSDGMLLFLSEQ